MSSKRTVYGLFIFLFLTIAIALSANALQEDFTAYSHKQTINLCACDLVEESLFVQNTGDITSAYFMTPEGTAAGWSTPTPDSFYLEQGERKEIKNFLHVPCSARGEYDLTTKIKTLFDYEKALTQTVNVQNCANVGIMQRSLTQQTCPCSPTTYEFEISNTGQHTEAYRINATPYDKYVTVSDPLIILEPGQSMTVYAFLNMPCDIYGDQEFTLNVLAEGTGMLGELDFKLMIDSCYDYRLESEDEYDVCLNVPNAIPVQITNLVDIANRYHLTIDGPVWAHFDNETTLFAWGMSPTTATIILEPTAEDVMTEEGTQMTSFQITVNAVSERGQLEASRTITINAENCYDLNVILQENFAYGIRGETKDHGFLLENPGTREATYLIEVFGPEWAMLNDGPEITLQPGQTEEVMVSATIPEDAEGTQEISLVGTITEYGIMRSNTLSIEPIDLEDAYRLDIKAKDTTISYEGDIIEIQITNLGVIEADYTATITAPEWILAENTEFTLYPGENTSIILNAAPTEDVPEDRYQIDVQISPKGTELYYVTSFLIGIGEPTFVEWLAQNWLLITLITVPVLLLLILLLIWLIKKRKEQEALKQATSDGRLVKLDKINEQGIPEKKRKWWIIPLILLILLAIVAGGAFLAMELMPAPEAVNETEYNGIITDDQGIISIDRSAVPGLGNVLEVGEPVQIVLDMDIKNPTAKNVIFKLNVQDDTMSWITIPENELYITPRGTARAQLIITPDLKELRTKDYSVTIGVDLRGEQISYEQSVDLIITKKKTFFDTWWFWLAIGLAVLIPLIILLTVIRKAARDRAFKRSLREEVADEEHNIGKKRLKEEKRTGIWKILLIIFLILLIAGGLFVAGWYLTKDSRQTADAEELPDEELEQIEQETQEATEALEHTGTMGPQEALVVMDLSGYEGEGNELLIDGYDIIYLNVTVTNPTNERALFTAVTSDSTWIEISEPSIELAPHSEYQTEIMIIPDAAVLKKQDYAVSVNSTLENEAGTVDYSQNLELIIKKKKSVSDSFWFYAIIGVIAAIIAVVLIAGGRKKKEEDYDVFFGDEDKADGRVNLEREEKVEKKEVKKEPKEARKPKKVKESKAVPKARTKIKLNKK